MYLPRLTHNLLGLGLDSFTILKKALRTVLLILLFKDLTHVYLEKTSMTHYKYSTFRFLEDNDPVSAKSAAQMLYLNLT